MRTLRYVVATTEIALVIPAVLFMMALFVRNIAPVTYEPARSAQEIVNWFVSLNPAVGLWTLLILLPFAALASGSAVVFRTWKRDPELRRDSAAAARALAPHIPTALTAAAAIISAGVLAVVAVHVLTN